jgi:hypothetical protein
MLFFLTSGKEYNPCSNAQLIQFSSSCAHIGSSSFPPNAGNHQPYYMMTWTRGAWTLNYVPSVCGLRINEGFIFPNIRTRTGLLFFAKKLTLSSYTYQQHTAKALLNVFGEVTHRTVWRKGTDTSDAPVISTFRVRGEDFYSEDGDSKFLRNMDTFLTRHIPQDNNLDMTLKPHNNLTVFYCMYRASFTVFTTINQRTIIQGVPGGKDLTSGECSLGQTIPI